MLQYAAASLSFDAAIFSKDACQLSNISEPKYASKNKSS